MNKDNIFDSFMDMNGDGKGDTLIQDTNKDGVADTYIMDSDGDGILDIQITDIDENGIADSYMIDTNEDGFFDSYTLDTNRDGYTETQMIDSNNDGIMDTEMIDSDGDGLIDIQMIDTDGDENFETQILDSNGDGIFDTQLVDSNSDGIFDTQFVDTDGDGILDTQMVDSDGDGKIDTVMLDENRDGVIDVQGVDRNNDGIPDGYASNTSVIAGNPEEDMDDWHMQRHQDTCAVVTQEFILDELTGHNFTEEELMRVAMANGWYTPGGGTTLENVGKLLENYGIDVERTTGNSMEDLENKLSHGEKIIVAVDSSEIWSDSPEELLDDLLSEVLGIPDQQPDHAVEVIGIDKSDPHNPVVILNDPGHPNGKGMRVSAEEFFGAWEDSDCYMVSTVGSGNFV